MTIVWLATAIDDLRQLRRFIAERDPGNAAVVVARIRSHVQSLEYFPNLGRVGRYPGTRELTMPRTPYIVIYRVLGGPARSFACVTALRTGPNDMLGTQPRMTATTRLAPAPRASVPSVG